MKSSKLKKKKNNSKDSSDKTGEKSKHLRVVKKPGSNTADKASKTSKAKQSSKKSTQSSNNAQDKATSTRVRPCKTASRDEPTTMDELFAQTNYTLSTVKKGQSVDGVIAFISPRQVRIDVGGKTEGVIHDKELELFGDFKDDFPIGAKVKVIVVSSENDQGQPVLSLRKSVFEKRWEVLKEKEEKEEIVDATITELGKGGFLIQILGLRGFLPFSQADQEVVRLKERAYGRKLKVKILEIDKELNRLVVSQRYKGQGGDLEKQLELLEKIKEGDIYKAEVTGVVPFGAFARVVVEKGEPAIEGLIHISEIAWEKVENPSAYLKQGQTQEVKVIGVDKKSGRLTLSMKQLTPDPWIETAKSFEKDQQLSGEVTRTSAYGVFVRLVPGIEGLVHISKIPPGVEPKVGDTVKCLVEEVDPKKRKISLSLVATAKPIGYR